MARYRPKLMDEIYGYDGDPTDQENRVAKSVNGRRQPGSGSSIYAKGDVIQDSSGAFDLKRFLIECKQTKHASLSIKGSWLSKITREAMAVGKEPALAFEIKGNDDPVVEQDWIALPMSVFKRLMED